MSVAVGAGRTGRKENRQNRRRLVIRLSDAEWAQVVAAAREGGYASLASYARVRIVTRIETRAVRRPSADRVLLAQALAQLGRVGGNLHQLVRHMNFGEFNALREAPAVLADVRAVARALMEALGRARHDH